MACHSKALHNFYGLGSFKKLYRYLDTPSFQRHYGGGKMWCTCREREREREKTDDSVLVLGTIIWEGDRKRAPFQVLVQFFLFFFEMGAL